IAVLDAVGLDDVLCGLVDFLHAVRELVIHHPARVDQPGAVLGELEDPAPVGPLALETGIAIVQAVAEDMEPGLPPGSQPPIHAIERSRVVKTNRDTGMHLRGLPRSCRPRSEPAIIAGGWPRRPCRQAANRSIPSLRASASPLLRNVHLRVLVHEVN